MADLRQTPGGYRFLPGGANSPYCSGVVADPGFEIIHATLRAPVPIWAGFDLVERHLAALGRPRQALCAFELRCTRPYPPEGWMSSGSFNQEYIARLKEWNLFVDGLNPIARSNVAPRRDPPAEQVLYAFSYTVPVSQPSRRPIFVVAGSGEDPAVRPGERSPEAIREKLTNVMATMAERLHALGADWADVTNLNLYLAETCDARLLDVIFEPIGPARRLGVHWYESKPPITDREVEMDLRGVQTEIFLEV
jgi:enamine deaminase RidA (YjgF/YER057c/UK114 family)